MKKPEFDIIEVTAMKFAATFYETGKSQGLTSKYKTERLYALHNFHLFIPRAIDTLTEMLSRDDIAENIKEKVYLALMERVNDPELAQVFPIETLPKVDIKKLLDNTPLAPIVVNTKPKRQKSVIEL